MLSEAVSTKPAPSKPMTIVMIEDDEGHARLIEKNMRRAGVESDLILFTTGAAGISYFQAALKPASARPPSGLVLLLDLNLPDMNGIDILSSLKQGEATRHIPIVILTTADDRAEIAHCYEVGCNVYVKKPVSYDAFANTIRQLALFFSIMQIPAMGQ